MEKDTRLYPYEVSVVVVTYNSPLEKTVKTLQSIVNQKNIHGEIVIADDGSVDNHAKEIENFLRNRHFSDYQMILNPENRGTVHNYISGVAAARGKYTKSISPGDYLAEEYILRKWIDFTEENKADWTFSDVCYYAEEEGKEKKISAGAFPKVIRPYVQGDLETCRWNYVVFNDLVLGAAMLGKTELKLKYAGMLEEKGVKFGEDYLFRVMMFDGLQMAYFPVSAVCYEYGTGISTKNDAYWGKILDRDWKLTNEIITERQNKDQFQESMAISMERYQHRVRKWFVKGAIRMWFNRHMKERMTAV